MAKDFFEIFNARKPVIGMIHLAGYGQEIVKRALREISLYEEEGVSGIIVENYQGTAYDVKSTLERLSGRENKLAVGINILGNPQDSFYLANEFRDVVSFIQIDSLHPKDISYARYRILRARNFNMAVFGGINFKYQTQEEGKKLEEVLRGAIPLCEAIVTTGEGTGIETPMENLKKFRQIMGDSLLISGAGINKENAYETAQIVDGIIVGSYLKNYDTQAEIIPGRSREVVREFNK